MIQRNLGRSGLKVSLVGLGCNNFGGRIGQEAVRKVVYKALDVGITLFDTADVYGNRGGSETLLGQILANRRKEVIVATKFGSPMDDTGKMKGASRLYIMNAVESSLRRLQTDWIDLYQLHFPDPSTPLEETLGALDDLVRQGKVRYIGCSNLPAWQVVDTKWICRQTGMQSFISCQDEYSLLVRRVERELLPAMNAFGLGLLPYFPLASGLLTGKYRREELLPKDSRFAAWPHMSKVYFTEENWRIVEDLRQFSVARNHSMLELALSWLAAQSPVSSIIAGATTPEQVEMNSQAVAWPLEPDELAEIDRITKRA
jgi:aryl-alcohol dehydrogenase-like predicted oxidoreductase